MLNFYFYFALMSISVISMYRFILSATKGVENEVPCAAKQKRVEYGVHASYKYILQFLNSGDKENLHVSLSFHQCVATGTNEETLNFKSQLLQLKHILIIVNHAL